MIDLSGWITFIGGFFLFFSILISSMMLDNNYTNFKEWMNICVLKWFNGLFLTCIVLGIVGFNYFENKDFNNTQSHNNVCEIGTVNYFEINALEIEREVYNLDETYFNPSENDTVRIGDVVEFCYKVPYRGKFLTSLNVFEIKE